MVTTDPTFLSLVPPLLAILLAIIFRQVILALLAGIYAGTFIISGYNPITGFMRMMDSVIVPAASDKDHASIIVFTMMLGGMVGIAVRSGGMKGIGLLLSKIARTRFLAQVATWLSGMFIFFDDYASTLIVGNTLRPVTDKLKISREKLAYIVDCTSAPIASIAIISTWIGFEIGLIGDSFKTLGLDYSPYQVFLETIPYRFYPIFSLFLVFIVASSGRELGPMLGAEKRAFKEGKLLRDGARPLSSFDINTFEPVKDKPHRWINALVPVFVVIIITLLSLWLDGKRSLISSGSDIGKASFFELLFSGRFFRSLGQIFGAGNSYNALLYSSVSGVITAGLMAVCQKILKIKEVISSMVEGFKAMLIAIIILILAWSIKIVCDDLNTAQYIVNQISGLISPVFLSTIIFLSACFISFSTGTSFGTMGILLPLTVPLAVEVANVNGLGEIQSYQLMVGGISSVLAGAIFGDHCSPISDTTIMSSMASSCDHIDHVRTQLPYALIAAGVGILLGELPASAGMSPWISILLAIPVFYGILFVFGKKVSPN